MATEILSFPSILERSIEKFWIENAARGGSGPSITGSQQWVQAPSGRWRASITVPVTSDNQYLEARGLMAALDGQAGYLRIGPVDYRGVPWGFDSYGRREDPEFARRPMLDGTEYADPENLIDGLIQATVVDAVPLNATSCRIQVTKGSPLKRGHYFEMNGRLHMVVAVTNVSGNTFSVDFRPWARPMMGGPVTLPAGSPVDLVTPTSIMRLNSADTGQIEMTTSPLSDLTIDLVEAF
jgi:hypothetical protein